jgi:fructokinase
LGGSAVIGGEPIRGLLHPEMGHILIPHDYRADPFNGVCPFHGDCWEGLACGLAIERRWGTRGELLPDSHEAWPLEARYLAMGVTNLICVLSPQMVILGGSVTKRPSLLAMVQAEVTKLVNGYLDVPELDASPVSEYIVRSTLGPDSGILGALEIARQALHQHRR